LSGDPAALAQLLTEDVVLISDGGGRVPAAIRPVAGRENVVRMIVGLSTKFRTFLPELRANPALVNGLPGLTFYDPSGPFQALALEARDDGKIAVIYVVRNPDKLRRLPAQPSA
jgi:RNA polymerase sigma-70 factor (ECF subfamily)